MSRAADRPVSWAPIALPLVAPEKRARFQAWCGNASHMWIPTGCGLLHNGYEIRWVFALYIGDSERGKLIALFPPLCHIHGILDI